MTSTTAQGSNAGLGVGPGERLEERAQRIGRHMSGVLVAAFTLSVVHTVYAWVEGIEDPTFTVDTPLAWGFYVVAFAMAALARRTALWAQVVVLAYLMVVLGIALFYYPTVFGPEQQTVFGWFENGMYVGLLFVAFYLGVVRLRRTTLMPH
jgi:peptidoglycan/LPS O-acetylase OafA/YrhL